MFRSAAEHWASCCDVENVKAEFHQRRAELVLASPALLVLSEMNVGVHAQWVAVSSNSMAATWVRIFR